MQNTILANNVIESKKNSIKRVLFSILIIITVVQQMPIIKDIYYYKIRVFLYFVFGIFSFLSLLNLPKLFKHKFVKYYLLCIIYFFLMIFANRLLKIDMDFSNIFELLIPFGILLCSLGTSFDNENLEDIVRVYVFLSAALGFSSIFYYGEGFKITEVYFLHEKNQLGSLLGISTVITIYKLFKVDTKGDIYKKKKYIIPNLILLFILLSSIIILRNRSGLVALTIVTFLIMFKEFKIKWTLRNILIFQLLLLVLVILIMTGFSSKVIGVIWRSITLSYDVTDLNSISAGRMDVYKSAIKFVFKYPMFGELDVEDKFYSIPHNYILNKWVRYGIVGSFPLVLFYLYLWKFVLVGLQESGKLLRKNKLVLWILLFSLIVSIFEYTYPFGPGISQVMVWFLLGQYLKEDLSYEQKNQITN